MSNLQRDFQKFLIRNPMHSSMIIIVTLAFIRANYEVNKLALDASDKWYELDTQSTYPPQEFYTMVKSWGGEAKLFYVIALVLRSIVFIGINFSLSYFITLAFHPSEPNAAGNFMYNFNVFKAVYDITVLGALIFALYSYPNEYPALAQNLADLIKYRWYGLYFQVAMVTNFVISERVLKRLDSKIDNEKKSQ
ncbi:hypothetical protein BZG36_01462 [Bifiguratus adelaidae]|uniref:Uncharacterized protein n=1 Tax=Bifiguratus adelaidae TaxID=1938954 RepID=A0A261Y4Z1_9FUNG|nr:hypothetical protein BZG36_01462 [Bifiguratus adelaidae]